MHHLDELVLDVGGLVGAVVIGRQRRSADQYVAHAHLAAAVALAVIAGKALDQHAAEFVLAAHEHVFPGHKQVVEDHQGLVAAELLVADVELAAFELAGVAGLAAVDVEDAFGVGRRHEGNGIVGVVLRHGDASASPGSSGS